MTEHAPAVSVNATATDTPVWEDGADLALEPLRGEHRAEVCVVGLGGSGLSAVTELLRAGVDVIGVDAGSVAGGAAGRNGGFLLAGVAAAHHDAVAALGLDKAVRLYAATADELERFASETPEAVRRPGSLRIAEDDDELRDCDAQFARLRADGFPVERYEGPEGTGLLFPNDGVFNPLRRCRQLARAAIDGGARLYERSRVVDVSAGRVTLEHGSVASDAVIVAVDGGLDALLPELGDRVRTARLQMLASAPTSDVRLPRPVYARYGYEYFQQLPGGEVALGGFRDRAGESEWTHERRPGPAVQAMLETYLRERIGVAAPVTHRWAASVGFTAGVLPLFTTTRGGVIACGGYNGTGNLVGALVGRGAAQVALTGRSEIAELFTGSARLTV